MYRKSKAETEERCCRCHLDAPPVAVPESAPLAVCGKLAAWLCMGYGAAPGVSLWGTLGDTPQGDGWRRVPLPDIPARAHDLHGRASLSREESGGG